MNKEILTIVGSWIICGYFCWRYIPRDRKRLAHLSFLFAQAFLWIFEYLQISLGIITFPVREFYFATKMSFSLHYFIYPTFFMFFIILFPKKKEKKKILLHYTLFSIAAPTYNQIIEKTTSLLQFHHWNFFLSVLSTFIILLITKKFICWFQQGEWP
ncbi:CBO0543 family protein [Neobacillus jeddahensis]|uniref:CBO0543 family protein n=1 Tax=Neobacillus jeddahensis TaxID=1461580 RepID=UPI00058CE72C